MNPLSVAVLQSGIVDRGMLEELLKWGAPIEIPSDLPPPPKTSEDALLLLEDALQSEGMVITRETDLEVLQQYLSTQETSTLHYAVEGVEVDVGIVFGRTTSGEIILPWRGESLFEAMTNGETFLVDGKDRVFFSSARDLFFGETQAFVVCTPSTREPLEESDADDSP